MGDEVLQDQAITLAVIHELVDGLEREYMVCGIKEEREGLVD